MKRKWMFSIVAVFSLLVFWGCPIRLTQASTILTPISFERSYSLINEGDETIYSFGFQHNGWSQEHDDYYILVSVTLNSEMYHTSNKINNLDNTFSFGCFDEHDFTDGDVVIITGSMYRQDNVLLDQPLVFIAEAEMKKHFLLGTYIRLTKDLVESTPAYNRTN